MDTSGCWLAYRAVLSLHHFDYHFIILFPSIHKKVGVVPLAKLCGPDVTDLTIQFYLDGAKSQPQSPQGALLGNIKTPQ